MIIVWLKALHISTLVVWCAGIIVLPVLFALRPAMAHNPDLWRLQHFVRESYRAVISPAAFLAVVSGTILIFAREVFTVWFAAKLAAVGLLTILHLHFGHVVLTVFKEDGHYTSLRKWIFITGALAVIGLILWLVLKKPTIALDALPPFLFEAGGLKRLAQSLSEIIRPMP